MRDNCPLSSRSPAAYPLMADDLDEDGEPLDAPSALFVRAQRGSSSSSGSNMGLDRSEAELEKWRREETLLSEGFEPLGQVAARVVRSLEVGAEGVKAKSHWARLRNHVLGGMFSPLDG